MQEAVRSSIAGVVAGEPVCVPPLRSGAGVLRGDCAAISRQESLRAARHATKRAAAARTYTQRGNGVTGRRARGRPRAQK